MGDVVRKHKDNVFCIMCRDKKMLLSIYNAVNNSDYADEEPLEIITLDGAVCMRMNNDAAFVIDQTMNLYEQQSTHNPNMPLRDLFYIAEELKKMIPMERLYRRKKIQMPEPTFVVFYNGEEKRPETEIMRLSDLFVRKSSEPNLELVVKVYNINKGYNDELLDRCESLRGYMIFVNKVREYKAIGFTTKEAVEASIDYCIGNKILGGFFSEHRKEILDMSIFEFDEELYEKAMREDGIEEGIEIGRVEGRIEGRVEGRLAVIKNMLIKGLDALSIAGFVDEDVSYVERIQELFLKNPECTVEELYSLSE